MADLPLLSIDVSIARESFLLECRLDIHGKCTAIFGPSGAGKSTLLDLINGNLSPDRGIIKLGKEILVDTSTQAFKAPYQRQIGWVPQDALLFPHLNVIDNLLFGHRRRRDSSHSSPSPHQVIGVLGLDRLLARWPRELSGGEKQRVALGRALLSNSKLLLLDEPLASLDAKKRSEILDLLDEIKHEFNIPIVHVTHSLAEVMRLADQLVLIDQGKIKAAGSIESLMGKADTPMLSDRRDAGSLLKLNDLTLVEGRPAVGLLEGQSLFLPLQAGEWRLPARALPLRVYVPAHEVILALEPPNGLSVRNKLACRIERLIPQTSQTMLVELAIGQQRLLASVTTAASEELGLRADLPVYALIKSLSLDVPAGRNLLSDSEHL
ncbi:MAG: molybdenum ABC transporter ATP-binding protein [Steroidobacteraceae bacterium]|nr:molybdenum ABC transporter ATP-binding protein [Gammaproteobacteria bacterium]